MLINYNIIYFLVTFFNILSFNLILLMRKSYNYEVILIFFFIVLGISLDPDRAFWLGPDSMNMDPKHCC